MRGLKNTSCFFIAGFVFLVLSAPAYSQGFSAWGFSCVPGSTHDLYTCSLSYDNQLGENALVLFLFIDSGGRVVSAPGVTAHMGSGRVESGFYCGGPVQPGTYNVLWKAYRESDQNLANEVAWSKRNETQVITCGGNAQQPPSLTLFRPEISGLTVTINGVTMPGTPGTTITRISWDWGDGIREDQWFAASHTYSRPGTYTITVTSFQSDGLSTTSSVTVTLSEPRPSQPPSLDLFTPEIQGLTVRINGVALPGTPGTVISRIHWDWGDGFRGDQWFAASHTYASPGTYTVTVTAFQSDGLSTTRTVTVRLAGSQPPSLTLFDPEIRGLTVTINGVTSPGTPGTTIVRIQWDWGDGIREDRWFAASHTYSRPGTYTITVSSFQSDGLSTTRSITVTLRGGAPPSLDLFTPEIRGLTVTINGVTLPGTPGATITRIHWDWGDGIREDRWFAASHIYSRPGTYTITVTSFQSDGLSTTRTVTVSLKEENKPPVADFSYSPSNPRVNETIQFTDRSYDPDGSITSWRWEFGDGSTSTLSNPSHSYSRPGTYNVWLYVTDNGGAAARASKTITVGEVNRPPYEPSNPYPPHRATDIPIDISLSWSGGDPDGDPVTYDIYFGTSSPPPLLTRGHSSSTYRLPNLDYNTKYYWSITASDGKGGFTRTPIWEFTTGARIKRLERLAIHGPTEVQGVSGNTVSYSCTAYFDDGTQEDVTNSATWGESFDSATISRGRLTVTSDLTSTQRGEVTCSYTYNAVAKSASLSVTLLAIAQDSIFRGIILVDRPIISFYSFDISIQTILSDPSGKLRVGDTVGVGGHRASPAKVDLVTVGDLVEVKGVVVSGPDGYGVQLTEARHYVKRIGTQGNLAYFDLDYRGSSPNPDGNEQRSITAQPGASLTLFFRYNEGNAGNQYVIRVYAEWDRTRPIANSDNDETISEVGAEIGGYRWDKETYAVPTASGTYKVRVVYSGSATPPTWDRYDKLLAEGTITVSQPQLVATELSILLEPSMIQEGTDRVIVVKGRLVRKDNMQGIAGKRIDILFSDWPKTAVTDSNGYYQTEYTVNLRAGSYEFTASFAGDNQYSASRATATLTVVRVEPLKPDLIITDIWWEPKEVYEGNEVMFYYIEKNQGSVASGDFGSAIYVDGQRICISARSSLAPGQSRERFCSYRWKATPGEHTIVVEADWAKEIDEANENNNKLEKKLGAIEAKQVVEIVSVSTDKGTYLRGEPVWVTVKIKNTGNVAVSGLRISVDIADPSGKNIKEGVFADGINLGGGGERTLSGLDWIVLSDAPAGTYTVTAGLHGDGVPYVEKKTSFAVEENKKVLLVPYYSQDGAGWCEETSLSMILKYYGHNMHPERIAELFGTTHDDSAIDDAFRYIARLNEWLPQTLKLKAKSIDLDPDSLKKSLDSDYPIFLALRGKPARHAIVIVGYEISDEGLVVFVNDPSGYITKHPGQARVRVKYNELKKLAEQTLIKEVISVEGNPSPPKGTIYLYDRAIEVRKPDPWDPIVTTPIAGLYLDRGIAWQYYGKGIERTLSLDNTMLLEVKCAIIGNPSLDAPQIVLAFQRVGSEEIVYQTFKTLKPIGPKEEVVLLDKVTLSQFTPGSYQMEILLTESGRIVDRIGPINFTITATTTTTNRTITFVATCPVDLVVTDPDGLIIDKQSSQIPRAIYTEADLNGDGDLDVQIIIPDPKMGDYKVRVVPKPQAKPTDTYTLEVTTGGKTKTLAREQQIKDIPATPYIFTSTGTLPPPPSTGLTIEEAVARLVPGDPSYAPDPDRVIGDQEIQQAMRLWKNREPVPNTGGQVISDEKMMELFVLWTKGTSIKTASASTGVALEVKRVGFTGSRFFAQGSGIKSIGAQVWDLVGKLIFSKEESGSVLAFNDRTLANGVYLYVVRVRGFDEEVYVSEVRKLVILR